MYTFENDEDSHQTPLGEDKILKDQMVKFCPPLPIWTLARRKHPLRRTAWKYKYWCGTAAKDERNGSVLVKFVGANQPIWIPRNYLERGPSTLIHP